METFHNHNNLLNQKEIIKKQKKSMINCAKKLN